jgi:hypothetical protein
MRTKFDIYVYIENDVLLENCNLLNSIFYVR